MSSERAEFLRNKIRTSQIGKNPIIEVYSYLQRIQYDMDLHRKTFTAVASIINFPDHEFGELAILCDRHGCNKGSLSKSGRHHPYYPMPPHTYTEIYETLFIGIRHQAQNIFECGIGTIEGSKLGNTSKNSKPGASLRVWRDYFPHAQIWGGDVDVNILFTDERINTGYLDQTSPDSITNFFISSHVTHFEVMIDDGLHTFSAAKCLFENATPFLAHEGIYIIEDLSLQFMSEFQLYMQYRREFIVKYFFMETPDVWGNNLIVIKKR